MCQQVFHMMFPTQIIKKFHLGDTVRVKASLDWVEMWLGKKERPEKEERLHLNNSYKTLWLWTSISEYIGHKIRLKIGDFKDWCNTCIEDEDIGKSVTPHVTSLRLY